MKREQKEQFNTSEDVGLTDNNHSSSNQEIVTNEAIAGTPFRMAGNPKQGYAITMGKYRLTDLYETEVEAMKTIGGKNQEGEWNVIANMIALMFVEMRKEETEEKEQIKKNAEKQRELIKNL